MIQSAGLLMLLLLVVGTAQFAAATEWESRLWRRSPGTVFNYLKIGSLWGGLGVGLFSLCVLGFADPALIRWMSGNGLVVLYLAVATGLSAWVARVTVRHPDKTGFRVANLLAVALLITFDYPVLKYLKDGVFTVYPEHTLAFALHLLSFASVLTLSTLTLGFSNLTAFRHSASLIRRATQPRLLYTLACLLLDVLWMILQADLIRLYPAASASGVGAGQPETSPVDFLSLGGLTNTAAVLIVFSVLVNTWNRRQVLRVQDVVAWNSGSSRVPAEHRLLMENTNLVKKALALSNVAVVTWHAPESVRGLGTSDLKTGTTFISPGRLHDAGLHAIGSDLNLPDFWKAIVHPDDYPATLKGLTTVLQGPMSTFSGQCRFRHPDGGWLVIRGHVEVEFSPVNGLPMAIYGIHIDLTEEAQANELLGAAKVRQLNALRMIGHDLRGSLSTVLMSSALMERMLAQEPSERLAKNVDRIKVAANKAIDYLSDAVTYARTEDAGGMGEPENIRLHNLLVETAERETGRYGLGIDKVTIDCDESAVLERVLAFPLSAVLGNLVSNAIKYTPDAAGKVHITVRSLGARLPGTQGSTLIEVADEGVGIPPEFADRMFKSFSRANNVGTIEGSGLGLAIVQNAVELLNAQISVVSVPERQKGSAFTLLLPNALALDAQRQYA